MRSASKSSNVQAEEASDQENDDDDADDVENVHVVFRSSHAPFQMKERRSRSKRSVLQLSSVQVMRHAGSMAGSRSPSHG
jgi:hypothetical protein